MNASIIIVVFNGRKYLQRCLSSVFGEVGEGDEVIIVDNASTDGSVAFIAERWPDVPAIRNATNRGFAAACNQAAKRATNEILVFLNQDTQVRLGWLDGLRYPFARDTGVGVVTSRILMMDQPEIIQAYGLTVHFSGLTSARGFGEPASAYGSLGPMGSVSGASFAIRREVWTAVGGFNEDFGMYYEDVDLSWRTIRQGWSCELGPESVVQHEQVWAPSSLVLQYIARNRYYLLLKNFHWLTLMILLPGLACAEGADWICALMRGKGAITTKWRAWRWLGRNYKSIVAARQRAGRGGDLAVLENCTSGLTPKIMGGGKMGRAPIALGNFLMHLNYGLAIWLLRRLKI